MAWVRTGRCAAPPSRGQAPNLRVYVYTDSRVSKLHWFELRVAASRPQALRMVLRKGKSPSPRDEPLTMPPIQRSRNLESLQQNEY